MAQPAATPVEPTKLRAVAISPDASRIATAGDDGLIRLWDTNRLKLDRVLEGHTDAVYALDFWTGNEPLLASAGWDGKVRIWNLGTGEATVLEDTARPTRLFSVAFYPGKPLKTLSWIAATGGDGLVRIWDVTKPGAAPGIKPGHDVRKGGRELRPNEDRDEFNTARSLSYAPSGSGEFVTGGYDGTLRFHRTVGKRIDAVDAHNGKVLSVAYSPDGRRVVSAGSDRDNKVLKLWNPETGRLIRSLDEHKHHLVAAAWSPSGQSIASGGGDKTIKIWDPDSPRSLLTIENAHRADVEAFAFVPDASRLISVGEDGLMNIWNLRAAGKLLLTAIGYRSHEFLAYTPAGCFTGSQGSDRYLRTELDRPGPGSGAIAHTRFVPEGFSLSE